MQRLSQVSDLVLLQNDCIEIRTGTEPCKSQRCHERQAVVLPSAVCSMLHRTTFADIHMPKDNGMQHCCAMSRSQMQGQQHMLGKVSGHDRQKVSVLFEPEHAAPGVNSR